MKRSNGARGCGSRSRSVVRALFEAVEGRVLFSDGVLAVAREVQPFYVGPMAADPGRDVVYVIDRSNRRVLAVDTEIGRQVDSARLAGDGVGLTVSVTGDRVFVSEPGSGRVEVFSAPGLELVDTLEVASPVGEIVHAGDDKLFGDVGGSIAQIDAGTGEVEGWLSGSRFSYYQPQLRTNEDGTFVYVRETGVVDANGGVDRFDVSYPGQAYFAGRVAAYGQTAEDFAVDEGRGKIYTADAGVSGVGVSSISGGGVTTYPAGTGAGRSVSTREDSPVVYYAYRDGVAQVDKGTGAVVAGASLPFEIDAASAVRMTGNGHALYSSTQVLGVVDGPATLEVAGVPTANFTVARAADGTYTFDAARSEGSIDGSPVVQWAWSFGDQTFPQQGQVVTHRYTAAGTYDVKLTVTAANGETDEAVLSLEALPPTILARPWDSYFVAEGGRVRLWDYASQSSAGAIVSYEWDFSYDGRVFTADAAGASVLFSAAAVNGPAVRRVAERVTDSAGNVSVTEFDLRVDDVPPALTATGPASATAGATYTLQLSRTDPGAGDTLTRWVINWGDGSAQQTFAGTATSASHVYAASGPVSISATGQDASGSYPVKLVGDGSLDPTFGGGRVIDTLEARTGSNRAVVAQPNGQAVVASAASVFNNGETVSSVLAVTRYTTSGARDSFFGTGGRVELSLGAVGTVVASGVAVQGDGKILLSGVVAGSQLRDYVVRLNANGTPDAGFGSGGVVLLPGVPASGDTRPRVVVQGDGRIVLAGNGKVYRFTSGGAADTTFGAGGSAALPSNFSAGGVAVTNAGKVLVAGRQSLGTSWAADVHRFTAAGAVDTAFGTNGRARVTVSSAGATTVMSVANLMQQADGRVVVAGTYQQQNGSSQTNGMLARFTADGAVDGSFAGGGATVFAIPGAYRLSNAALQADDRIVVTGSGQSAVGSVMRFAPGGTVDSTFGTNGVLTLAGSSSFGDLDSVAVRPDGNLFVGGAMANGTSQLLYSVRSSVAAQAGTIRAFVFEDDNGNGVRDVGEGPAVEALVRATRTTADPPPTQDVYRGITDVQGFATLDVPAGTYAVDMSGSSFARVTTPVPVTATVTSGLATGVTIGRQRLGNVDGYMYRDANNNGVRDSGDTGLEGYTVYLDANGNGALDAGERSAASAGAAGYYTFAGVIPGAYTVRVSYPSTLTPRTPASAAYDVTVGAGARVSRDFGFATTPVARGNVAGTLYVDANANALPDPGEGGLQGYVVYQDVNNDGVLQAAEPAALTNAAGYYVLSDLASGPAVIRLIVPSGYAATTAAVVNVAVPQDRATATVNFGVRPTSTSQPVRLTGSAFGTAGSYGNQGNTFAKAMDGNTTTYFDGPAASGNYFGLDLGTARQVTSVRFYPRANFAGRMVGGKFQGSNTSSTAGFVDLATVTSTPANNAYTTVTISNPTAFRYVRYVAPDGSYGNVAEVEFYGVTGTTPTPTAPAAPSNLVATINSSGHVVLTWADNADNEQGFRIERSTDGTNFTHVGTNGANETTTIDGTVAPGTHYHYRVRAYNDVGPSGPSNEVIADTPPRTGQPVKLTGTAYGTAGSYGNFGNTFAKALDGDLATYFDAPTGNGNYVGLDLGAATVITSVRYAPRSGHGGRMVGGRFQGSNVGPTSGFVDLYTITAAPSAGTLTAAPVSNTTAFRWVRYLAPDGSYGNVAEVEFFGGGSGPVVTAPAAPSNLTAGPSVSPGILLNWTDNATNETGFKVERSSDAVSFAQVGTAGAGATSFLDTTAGQAVYYYRVRATNTGGDSGYSNVATADNRPANPGTPVRLSGTAFGTTGSYGNFGNTFAKAFDANTGTYFDAPVANGVYLGLDLGTAAAVTSVRFFPRAGHEGRMVGGRIQGSNTSATGGFVDLATITTRPAGGVFSTVQVSGTAAYRYVRYVAPDGSYGNVAELEFYGTTGTTPNPEPGTPVQLSGASFGTAGSYGNLGNTYQKALDGDAGTFFDSATASGNVVGLDLGTAKVIKAVRFTPRAGFAGRMVGGKFQGSNTSATGGFVDLFTVTAAPAAGETTVTIADPTAYRWVRYVAPDGSWGNVAEVGFFG